MSDRDSQSAIDSVLRENRVFPPPAEFSRKAHVSGRKAYDELYKRSVDDPEGFWAGLAEQKLRWTTRWSKVLDWQPPFAKWFVGGKTRFSRRTESIADWLSRSLMGLPPERRG